MDAQTTQDDLARRGLWIEGISDSGAPMHAEANGWYFYADFDGRGVGHVGEEWRDLAPWQRGARYLRVTDAEMIEAENAAARASDGRLYCPAFARIPSPCPLTADECSDEHIHEARAMTRTEFGAFVDSLRPRWAAEGPAIHARNVEHEQAEERTERDRDAAIARGVTITSTQRDPTPRSRTTARTAARRSGPCASPTTDGRC